jgi:cell pole-organizing protein PopZ
MEELLASIRKAIHDDIGEVPASMSSRASGTLQRGSMRELHVKIGDEAGSAATEIQQLREKINRSRGTDPQMLREAPPVRENIPARESQPQRSAGLAAALQTETPRRSWRDLEPQPKLRSSIIEQDYPPQLRTEFQPRRESPQPQPAPAFVSQPSWQEEPPALPPPSRESYRPDIAGMLSGDTSQAVQSAFNRLADTVLSRATGDRSIEELTRELLRGMLKQWLDDNLPSLVERLVREEIERVARHGR